MRFGMPGLAGLVDPQDPLARPSPDATHERPTSSPLGPRPVAAGRCAGPAGPPAASPSPEAPGLGPGIVGLAAKLLRKDPSRSATEALAAKSAGDQPEVSFFFAMVFLESPAVRPIQQH